MAVVTVAGPGLHTTFTTSPRRKPTMTLSTAPTPSPILDAALRYIRRGWFVLPINPAAPPGASEDQVRRAKAPCTANGVDNASNTTLVIEGWFGPNALYPSA